MIPQRIQLRRTKGWRMPDNTVKVDRASKWGNPFRVGESGGSFTAKVKDRRHAWQLFAAVAPDNAKLCEAARAELAGKNLACWCPLPSTPYAHDECHAAVLLSIANPEIDFRAHRAASAPTLDEALSLAFGVTVKPASAIPPARSSLDDNEERLTPTAQNTS